MTIQTYMLPPFISLGGGETNFKVVLTRVFGVVVVYKTAYVSFHPKVLDSIN